MIKISGLHFAYKVKNKYIKALNGIDLEIPKGEFVVFLGPNGSGKSTLIKHINGLLTSSSGEVVVDGINAKEDGSIWKLRQKVGMVFQNPDNQIVANVVENDVAFGPENLGLSSSEIKERVKKSLFLTKILEYSKYDPHSLSGGQKQLVAIAGALAIEPEYLILDEPTSMLDSLSRKKILKVIYDLNKNNKTTILLVTHFTDEAVNADKVYILDAGKIVCYGEPRETLGNIDLLNKFQIKPLAMTSLASSLVESGINISTSVLTVDEMVEAICLLS